MAKVVDAQRVVVVEQRHDVVDPAAHVGLAHPELDLLVEHGHHRHRVGHAAVDAAERDGAAAAHDVDRQVQRAQPVDAGVLHQRLGHRVRQQRGRTLLRQLADGRRAPPCRRRRSPRPRPRPSVIVADDVARASSTSARSIVVDPVAAARGEPLGHEVDADHLRCAAVQGDPGRHVADRAEAEDDHGSARRARRRTRPPATRSAARRRGRRSGRPAARRAP